MRSTSPALLSLGALLAPSLAFAQTSAPASEQVVVTASRLRLGANASAHDVQILPEARLDGAVSIADALADTADVYVQSPGGRSGFASVFLRGADPNFTSVLLDGIPLNNPTNTRGGAVNVSELDASAFERVEIITGARSSLFGSGALAGAVNLIMPAGADDTIWRTSVGLGSDQDYSAFARVRGPLMAGYGGSLSLNAAGDGDGAGGAGFESRALTGKIAPLRGDGESSIVFRLAKTDIDAFPDSSGGDQFAEIRALERHNSEEGLIGMRQRVMRGDVFDLTLAASALSRRDETETPGVAPSAFDPFGLPSGVDDTRYTRALAHAVGAFDLGHMQALVGLEAQSESGRSAGELVYFGMSLPSAFEIERATYSGFGETAYQATNWTFSASARVDKVDDIDANATARLGVRYEIAGTGLSVRTSGATGFKAPSLYALGNPFVGNRDLEPETSRTWDVGLDWADAYGNALTLSLFHTRYANLIDFDPGPPPRLTNRDAVESKGASLRLAHRFSDELEGAFQAHYSETRDSANDEALFNRPDWRASTSLTWRASEKLTLTARHSFVGERRDYAIPTGVRTLESYNTFSLDTGWRILPDTGLRLVIDNALDDDHVDSIGFSAPGRRVRLRLTRDF